MTMYGEGLTLRTPNKVQFYNIKIAFHNKGPFHETLNENGLYKFKRESLAIEKAHFNNFSHD